MPNKRPYIDKRIATMLFVDLVGSSEAASLMNPEDYKSLVSSFQNKVFKVFKNELCSKFNQDTLDDECQQRARKDWGIKYYEVRGDEGFLILVSKYNINDKNGRASLKDIRENLLLVFRIALRIKYEWLFEPANIDRFKDLKKPYEIAIGINTGIVTMTKEKLKKEKTQKQKLHQKKSIWKAEGYAINLAKRIENQSRQGEYSNIFVSEYTFGYYSDIPGENTLRFKQNEKFSLKGISGTVRTYELIYAILDEEDEILQIPRIVLTANKEKLKKIEDEFKDSLNPWLGNVLCNIKWKKFGNHWKRGKDRSEAKKILIEASDIARKLIEIDPQTPSWKIYLAQIIFDYVTSYPKDYKIGSEEESRIYKILVKNTVGFLSKLTEREPHELDARLFLGRFYLEVKNIDKILGEGKEVQCYYDLALDEFQSIIIWQEKFPDAYYYLSACYLKVFPSEKEDVIKFLKTAINLAKKINVNFSDRIKIDARKDTRRGGLFAEVKDWSKFKKLIS